MLLIYGFDYITFFLISATIKYRTQQPPYPTFPISPTISISSISALSDHFTSSYRLFRSLQSSFIRSDCASTPSRQSDSILLYYPIRLWIVLLFVLICSNTHIQSIQFRTSISVTYNSVFVKVFAHSRTMR